jgi:integrase
MSVLLTKCGRVRISPPLHRGGYWRLDWKEHGKRRQGTGGRTVDTAKAKAFEIVKRLDADVQPEGETTLGEALEQFLLWGKVTGPLAGGRRRPWSDQYAHHMRVHLTGMLRPYMALRCDRLDRRILTALCDSSSTANVARSRRSDLQSFLAWGRKRRVFTPEQADALAQYEYSPKVAPPQKPARKSRTRVSGEGGRYVQPDEVPSHAQILRLGEEMQALHHWGRLAVELAAATGLRIGELLALDAAHVDVTARRIFVEHQVLAIRASDGGRLAPPKGHKTRTAVFPATSATGYLLQQSVELRLERVQEEHKAGKNPHRLLFPAQRGGHWWATSFTNDVFSVAAEAAGWERLTWQEKGKTRYQWRHTMHSLRHRFAHDAIEKWGLSPAELTAIGGWDSIAIVFERYYGQDRELLDRVTSKMA